MQAIFVRFAAYFSRNTASAPAMSRFALHTPTLSPYCPLGNTGSFSPGVALRYTPGCVLAPIQGAGGGDDWMLWGGCLGFAVSDGAEEGGDGDGDADSCDDAASVTDVCDG